MTDTKLLPTRVIVDRAVLVALLENTENYAAEFGEPYEHVQRLKQEVESGQRVELYAKDWPGSGE